MGNILKFYIQQCRKKAKPLFWSYRSLHTHTHTYNEWHEQRCLKGKNIKLFYGFWTSPALSRHFPLDFRFSFIIIISRSTYTLCVREREGERTVLYDTHAVQIFHICCLCVYSFAGLINFVLSVYPYACVCVSQSEMRNFSVHLAIWHRWKHWNIQMKHCMLYWTGVMNYGKWKQIEKYYHILSCDKKFSILEDRWRRKTRTGRSDSTNNDNTQWQ